MPVVIEQFQFSPLRTPEIIAILRPVEGNGFSEAIQICKIKDQENG